MYGQTGGSYTSDSEALPTIMATDPAHSAIHLKGGGALSGLMFRYLQDETSATPTQYATTILLNGTGTRVSNVRIHNAWKGIEGVNTGRSVPLGKYCRSSPLVFSFDPRCQGLLGSGK